MRRCAKRNKVKLDLSVMEGGREVLFGCVK